MFLKKLLPSPFSNKLDENIKKFYNGKVSCISSIFSVFSENNDNAKFKASRFLLKLINEKSFNDFIRITEHMHGSYYLYYGNSKWFNIIIKNLSIQKMSMEEKRAVLIFASFHSNGYLREKVIKELISYPNTLQYILLRRNDWVSEVRNVAKCLLVKKYNNLNDGELLNSIPAIQKLIKCERDNFKEEYESFILKLLNNDIELNNGLNSNNSKIRLFCAELLMKKNISFDKLKAYLIRENIPNIRKKIYNLYLNNSSEIDKEILEIMLIDHCAIIRIMAINFIYSNHLRNYDFAFDYLLDSNANVRELARYIIKQTDESFSFRDYYLNALKDNYVAIAGLGETGTKEDTMVIEKFMEDKSVKIVRNTINALIKLDKEKYLKDLILLLNDERQGIVKDIALILSKEAQFYEDELRTIFNHSRNSFTRLKCAKLLFSVSKWNALNYMILALNDEDSIISELAKISIEQWIKTFNKSFISLSNKQREILIDNVSKIKRKDIEIKKLFYYLN